MEEGDAAELMGECGSDHGAEKRWPDRFLKIGICKVKLQAFLKQSQRYISKNFLYYSGIRGSAGIYFGWSLLFLGVIYLIYFCITYEECKRNIWKKETQQS